MPQEKTIEQRVEDLERAVSQTLGCLGLALIKGPDGRLGYSIPRQGPPESWGILAKILSDLKAIKDEKRIIIPGR